MVTTISVSEKTFNAFKAEQLRMRQTGKKMDTDELVAYLLDLSRKVNK